MLKSEINPPQYYKVPLPFIFLRLGVGTLLKILFRIEVKGLEYLPEEGGYILAGNHLSWIDPFLMLAGAPAEPRIFFIAAREDVENPEWRKYLCRNVGAVIPVDRGRAGSYREVVNQARKVLEGGGVLGIFPEGDVSGIETGKLLPLKKGMGFFASQTGAAIVPVGFSGTKELWLRKKFSMVIGKPIPGQKGGRTAGDQLTAETARAIAGLLTPPPPFDPSGPRLLKDFFTNLFTQEEKEHPIPE